MFEDAAVENGGQGNLPRLLIGSACKQLTANVDVTIALVFLHSGVLALSARLRLGTPDVQGCRAHFWILLTFVVDEEGLARLFEKEPARR